MRQPPYSKGGLSVVVLRGMCGSGVAYVLNAHSVLSVTFVWLKQVKILPHLRGKVHPHLLTCC